MILDIPPSSSLPSISLCILNCVALFWAYNYSMDTIIHPMSWISDILGIVSAQYNNDHYQMVSVLYDERIYLYKSIIIVPFISWSDEIEYYYYLKKLETKRLSAIILSRDKWVILLKLDRPSNQWKNLISLRKSVWLHCILAKQSWSQLLSILMAGVMSITRLAY